MVESGNRAFIDPGTKTLEVEGYVGEPERLEDANEFGGHVGG